MAAFAVAALATLAAEARTYALVVGIDDYAHLPSLAGAANDARDLAHVLRERGARVTLLINAEATRASVMDEWTAIMDAVQPGDSIVFTYAGHGAQLPEQLPGDEADGKDEVFLMHGFAIHGKDRGKLIRDNDIALMLEKIPPEVPVLVVADSCHSGTMTRAPDPRGDLGPTRYVAIGPAAGPAPLPPPPPQTRGVEAGDLPNVIFAYAAQDDQVTPEIRIDGQYRGALSWSVARALAHHLDGPPPSLGEFRSFVVAQVRALSGARQTPGVEFSRALAIRAAGEGIAALTGENVIAGAAIGGAVGLASGYLLKLQQESVSAHRIVGQVASDVETENGRINALLVSFRALKECRMGEGHAIQRAYSRGTIDKAAARKRMTAARQSYREDVAKFEEIAGQISENSQAYATAYNEIAADNGTARLQVHEPPGERATAKGSLHVDNKRIVKNLRNECLTNVRKRDECIETIRESREDTDQLQLDLA